VLANETYSLSMCFQAGEGTGSDSFGSCRGILVGGSSCKRHAVFMPDRHPESRNHEIMPCRSTLPILIASKLPTLSFYLKVEVCFVGPL
jgi:hypothetical protein